MLWKQTDHEDRKIISDQKFVEDFGVKTVFGIGGAYKAEHIFVTILFCRDNSSRADAERLKVLINSFRAFTRGLLEQGTIFKEEEAPGKAPIQTSMGAKGCLVGLLSNAGNPITSKSGRYAGISAFSVPGSGTKGEKFA